MDYLRGTDSTFGLMEAHTMEISDRDLEAAMDSGEQTKEGFSPIKGTTAMIRNQDMGSICGTTAGPTKETSITTIETDMDSCMTPTRS